MPVLSKAELLNLSYTGSSPQGEGPTAEHYRTEYRLRGRPVRWWKAIQVGVGNIGPGGAVAEDNGYCYIEQTYAVDGTTLLTTVRAMFWGTQRTFPHQQFGVVSMGTNEIGVLPDEIELARMDRICPTDVSWTGRYQATRGGTTTDALPFKPVTAIGQVVVAGAVKDAATYEFVSTGIHWLSSIPSAGTVYEVQYKYHPMFEFLGSERALMQKGADGNYLPQRGSIRLMQADAGRSIY